MIAPLALAAIVLWVGGGTPLSPVEFERKPDWHVGAERAHACPGVPRAHCMQVGSWAATIRWRDSRDSFQRTVSALPPDGIAIYLMLAHEAPKAWQGPIRWPPTIRLRDVHGPFKGLQGRGYYGRAGRLRGFSAQLFVFFGRPQPTARQLGRANAALRTARLP